MFFFEARLKLGLLFCPTCLPIVLPKDASGICVQGPLCYYLKFSVCLGAEKHGWRQLAGDAKKQLKLHCVIWTPLTSVWLPPLIDQNQLTRNHYFWEHLASCGGTGGQRTVISHNQAEEGEHLLFFLPSIHFSMLSQYPKFTLGSQPSSPFTPRGPKHNGLMGRVS